MEKIKDEKVIDEAIAALLGNLSKEQIDELTKSLNNIQGMMAEEKEEE